MYLPLFSASESSESTGLRRILFLFLDEIWISSSLSAKVLLTSGEGVGCLSRLLPIVNIIMTNYHLIVYSTVWNVKDIYILSTFDDFGLSKFDMGESFLDSLLGFNFLLLGGVLVK